MHPWKFLPTCVLSSCMLLGQTVSFRAPNIILVSGSAVGTSVCNSCVATADFDDDGRTDIVYGYAEGPPSAGVLLGNGNGTFRPGFTFVDQTGAGPNTQGGSILVADFNGDGKPDVAFFSYLGQRVEVYLGLGGGNFGSVTVTSCGGSPVAADVNGDGEQDLVCGTSVLLSNGDGSFRALPATLAGNALVAADFNGDGKIDLLVATAGQLAVALGNGDGTFFTSRPLTYVFNSQSILPGDFNGDGFIDLVGASADGTAIVVLPGLGDGTFAPAILTSGSPGSITAAADFNGDRKLDLVAGQAILAGNGDGTFRFPVFADAFTRTCDPQTVNYSNCSRRQHVSTSVGDFNNDGLPDLALSYLIYGTQTYANSSQAQLDVMLNDSPGNGFTAMGVSAATGSWPVASGSIVSAFGIDLAPVTETASTKSLPTTLGGIRVHVNGNTLAPLLYVSPGQINYVVQSTDSFAWIDIERIGSPYIAQGMTVPIVSIAPGLFTLNGTVVAATAVSVGQNGAQTPVSVSSPIDLSGSPIYLSLYGTGFDLATTATSSCTIAGQTLQATYAGTQGQIAGLDQINILLPRSLAGSGTTSITCKLGSPPQTSNTVTVTIL